ncbi:MAG: chromosome segregation protein SMC, partial [Chloroflexi bacterium]|nr:chromosome segregation protein SMC [Chloroflexota bacterium]
MRLKQLELYGYKSFASRTVFAFGEGLTAIVGPNGSGKSNITDALRWVLGEQSNRTLRAGSSEEMIFSGGPRRPRLGMAEVLLTLDNASGWLPIAYTEVAIGRRAYRSGDSEYLLNGQRVRYRDLVELLEQGGLGGRGQVIIGQGMVDAVLSLSPDARRALFEEAAGIAPHLRKRAEALRRIEETERNLERVGDILAELRPRAGRLRRQADRAEEQRLLAQDLYQLQRIWYGYQWQRRYREVARAREELAQATLQLDQQRAHVQGLDAQRTALDAQRAEGTRALERQRQAEGAIRDRSEALRRELAVLAERVRLYAQQEGALDAEIASLASRADILQGEVSRTRQALDEQEQSRAEAEADLAGVRAQMADADRAAGRLRQEVAAAQKGLAETAGALADAQARLAQGAKQRALWSAEADDAQAALAQLAEREADLRGEGEALDERARALQGEERRLADGRAALEREGAAAQERLREAEAAVARARSDRERLVRRRDALAQVRQEMAAYAPGVRAVLAEGDRLPGILGTVAALMAVPRELERAIEAALGSRLQNLVTERWADAERAIAHLKETRSGWATFLPLDTVRSGAALRPPASPGVVGVASELVQYDARLRPAYQLLLGRVLVVRDLPTARRLLDERTGASLLVTLEGEAVQASGAVTGGA